MTTIVSTCRECGSEYEPSREAIQAGTWRRCPACTPEPAETQHCLKCNRPLRLMSRSICARCMGVAL